MSAHHPSRLVVVGLGADGLQGLPDPVRARVRAARVVLGGERHLALLPPDGRQLRVPWPRPFRDGLKVLLEEHLSAAPGELVVLASGDPLVSGAGSTLIELLGADRVEVIPAVSSVALARARMGWSAESTEVVSLVGRPPELILRHLVPGGRLLLLSSDDSTPAAVAGLLSQHGYGESQVTVLGDLGSTDESVATVEASAAAAGWPGPVSRLNIVAVELSGSDTGSWAPGLPDGSFEHDGQLTKRDLRASALSRLRPQPGQLLWDVGAGAGSVGIEWMRAHPRCHAVAVEADSARADRIGRNAARLGVPGLRVVHGRAPGALLDLPAPDAVFVGGGATGPGVLEGCWERLRPGGRLVAHGVTVETEAALARAYTAHGGELVRLAVEHAAPLGGFTGWTPARTVTQWAATKPPGKPSGSPPSGLIAPSHLTLPGETP